MNFEKGDNVVVYLTGNIQEDKAIKKFCKDKKLKIIKVFKPNMEESGNYWNTALFNMYFEIVELRKKYYIKNIITYDLENLFWNLCDQIAIAEMLFDSGAPVFTLKEGDIYYSEITKISLNIPEKNIKNLRKYWVKEDKKQNEEELKNEKK